MRKIKCFLIILLPFFALSCKEETDLSPLLSGLWQQSEVFIDDELQNLSDKELNTSLFIEANGVYRLYDGVSAREHTGTWLFSDEQWLNVSMDKIQGKNADNTYRFGQVLVRFTILHVDANTLELRIKTYLLERKLTVMFNLIGQDDTSGMTAEEKIELDRKNKEQHTYRYIFKKVNLKK